MKQIPVKQKSYLSVIFGEICEMLQSFIVIYITGPKRRSTAQTSLMCCRKLFKENILSK